MSKVLSLSGPPPSHDNIRSANSKNKPLDKNFKGAANGPGASLDANREISRMITGQVNAANMGMGKNLNIFI